jgi:hypothetical protein
MIKLHDPDGYRIAEETSDSLIISSVDDAVDLLGNLAFDNCSTVILKESNLHPDFFILHTRLAGDVLQKFSNYNFRLAIIGNFSKYQSKSLQDFIRECNKGNRVHFVSSIEEALLKMKKVGSR